jgi:hypothetical protein
MRKGFGQPGPRQRPERPAREDRAETAEEAISRVVRRFGRPVQLTGTPRQGII